MLADQKKYLQDFIIERCGNELVSILKAPNQDIHYGLPISVLELFDWNEEAGDDCISAPLKLLPALTRAIQSACTSFISAAQRNSHFLTPKPKILPRLQSLPVSPWTLFERLPSAKSVQRLITFRGTVIRVGGVRMQEAGRDFACQRCDWQCRVEANDWAGGVIEKPLVCAGEVDGVPCKGNKLKDVTQEQVHVDYQEIKVQELTSLLAVGSVPRSLSCILKHDLVDSCRAGEEVLVTGVLGVRSSKATFKEGVKLDGELFLLATSVVSCNSLAQATNPTVASDYASLWADCKTAHSLRNAIVDSFCPGIHGMFLVKLATLLTIIGGNVETRREGHILLVGDPGTGKSQFLLNATKLLPRSLIISGSGSTAAGLTATAIKDSTGHWSLEAGALVLADRGVCAVDEFGGMKKADRAAVHEAMEQQTVSIAKAGMVCKLNTRCSIVAACNPQSSFDDAIEGVTANVAIASPLLSRFDLIFMLSDRKHAEGWDSRLADEILGCNQNKEKDEATMAIDLKSYVAMIRDCNPELNAAATLILSRYYQLLRSFDPSSSTRTTPRLLGSLARLCVAHSKLRMSLVAGADDAVLAVLLMEQSLGVRPLLEASGWGLFDEAPSAEFYAEFRGKLLEKLEIRAEAIAEDDGTVVEEDVEKDVEDVAENVVENVNENVKDEDANVIENVVENVVDESFSFIDEEIFTLA